MHLYIKACNNIRRRSSVAALLILSILALSSPSVASSAPQAEPNSFVIGAAPTASAEIVVYGGTPSGVLAAVTARRAGATVILVEPSAHVGGIITNGLTATDYGRTATIGGYTREFFDRTQALEGTADGRYHFQPKTAERAFEAMLTEAGVRVYRNQRLAETGGVTKLGTRITAIRMLSGQVFSAEVFIDASYEGDLMADAGVAYRVGREARNEYNEPFAGVWPSSEVFGVPDGIEAGIPLAAPGPVGSADARIQNSNYRLCFSKVVANQVPFAAPTGYNPAQYDLIAAYIASRVSVGQDPVLTWFLWPFPVAGGKYDVNENGLLSIGVDGLNYDYPDGTYAQRAEIESQLRQYTQGFLYFLARDSRVPAAIRSEMAKYGLCKDEFADNANWPRALYLREGRRMLGTQLLTEHDAHTYRAKPDIIGVASYNVDSHYVSRWIADGRLYVEGGFLTKGSVPWAIPYGALIPKATQVTNLLVSVTASATHVATASLRMEPQYMMMGEASGQAAAMTAKSNGTVQGVNVKSLQTALRAHGVYLTNPLDYGDSPFYADILWIFQQSISSGCGAGNYCPRDPMTREQMSSFLVNTLKLPATMRDYFKDDETSPFEAQINALAASGITLGCGSDKFCPGATVTREQMASFLVRAFKLPATTRDYFSDDDTSTHQSNINALAASGITLGCGATTFCPRGLVNREQMAAFLHRGATR